MQLEKEFIDGFCSLYRGRTDAWGSVEGLCNKEQVTTEHYERHLKGEVSLGIYPLLDDGTCHWFAIDLDEKDFNKAKTIRQELFNNFMPVYIAESKSKGYHIYGFALNKFIAKDIRRVLRHILSKLNIKAEIFPKQDIVGSITPLGNYINLPCFGATRPFLSGELKEVHLDIALERIKFIPEEAFTRLLSTLPEEKPLKPPQKLGEEPLIQEEESEKLNEIATKKLLEACVFLKHCQKDATTLPEPHW